MSEVQAGETMVVKCVVAVVAVPEVGSGSPVSVGEVIMVDMSLVEIKEVISDTECVTEPVGKMEETRDVGTDVA